MKSARMANLAQDLKRKARVQPRGRWFVFLAVAVDLPLLVVFSLTKVAGWLGTATVAFTLLCTAFYVLAERDNL